MAAAESPAAPGTKRKTKDEESSSATPKKHRANTNADGSNDYVMKADDVFNLGRYTQPEYLGCGAFGVVWRFWDEHVKEAVAIKIIKNDPPFFKQAQTEIEILKRFEKDPQAGKHIVRLKDSFIHEGHQCLVFELLSDSLFHYLQNPTNKGGLNLDTVRNLGHQIISALAVLERQSVIHSDLKPENILFALSPALQVKLIDFGSACLVDHLSRAYIQSRYYRAPEVLFGFRYSTGIDMWSVGCVLVELFVGETPFGPVSEEDLVHRHVAMFGMPPASLLVPPHNEKITKFFFDTNPMTSLSWCRHPARPLRDVLGSKYLPNSPPYIHFQDLLRQIFVYDPRERITPTAALCHPFFTHAFSPAPHAFILSASIASPPSSSSSPPSLSYAQETKEIPRSEAGEADVPQIPKKEEKKEVLESKDEGKHEPALSPQKCKKQSRRSPRGLRELTALLGHSGLPMSSLLLLRGHKETRSQTPY